jgi:hypothetical protein
LLCLRDLARPQGRDKWQGLEAVGVPDFRIGNGAGAAVWPDYFSVMR